MDLSRAAWRKSSRSGGNGGECVEVAAVDVARDAWRKSSRSAGQGGSCVEATPTTARVAVRDSKDPQGPALLVSAREWRAFVGELGDGRFR